jgi:uncharacterized membrane protein (UPF0127 family)
MKTVRIAPKPLSGTSETFSAVAWATLGRHFLRAFLILIPGILLLTGVLVGCEQPIASAAGQSFPLRLEGVDFTAELALTPEEMATGLMHRGELSSDHGMLFIYPEPRRLSFWMKNTHIPLDLGFFSADGRLQEVKSLTPYDLKAVPSQRADIVYALEMNRGWFARQGLEPGARLDLDRVHRAVEKKRRAR